LAGVINGLLDSVSAILFAGSVAVNLGKAARGPEINARVAKHVLGWKNVHRDRKNGKPEEVWAKKPDKLGRWRKTKVPNFCGDGAQVAAIENRLRQLGHFELYAKELAKVASAKGLPAGWATPDQHCRAALKVVSKRAKQH
jgi:hypothetical protein